MDKEKNKNEIKVQVNALRKTLEYFSKWER